MHIVVQHRDNSVARVVVQTGNVMPRAKPSSVASNQTKTSVCLSGFPPQPSVCASPRARPSTRPRAVLEPLSFAPRYKRVVQVKESEHGSVDPLYGEPEYESLSALGSNGGVDDLIALAKANELGAAYGFDTISMGATIAFAMECFEHELVSAPEMDGVELRFGNARAMLEMIRKIARREGFGNVLAEGAARAAKIVGRGAEEFAMHAHGQDVPMHEPRLKAALGVGYAVSPTGADHMHNLHDTGYTKENEGLKNLRTLEPDLRPLPANDLSADKMRLLIANANWAHVLDSAVMCHFLPYTPQQMTDVLNAATGWEMTPREYHQIGTRAATIARVLNLREGWSAAGDTLPKRIFKAFESGPLAGQAYSTEKFAAATREYYRQMGWDEQGAPTGRG